MAKKGKKAGKDRTADRAPIDGDALDRDRIDADPQVVAGTEGAKVLARLAPSADPIQLGDLAFDLDDPLLPPAIADAALASGGYPYADGIKDRVYAEQLRLLQIELVKLQRHVSDTGARVVIVFEGRDAAGKGGTIGAFRAYMNPRSARTVALPKPSDVERGQWYFQRYVSQLPTRGEIVLFDRSWYNRAVVEPVMGFCTPEETDTFLTEVKPFEALLVRDGVVLVKIWLDIGREMQLKRFHDRRHDPLKVWKLSPVDLKALTRWDAYSAARDRMLAESHSAAAPWTVVLSNDKKRAHLNAIRHVLLTVDYTDRSLEAIGALDPLLIGSGPGFLGIG